MPWRCSAGTARALAALLTMAAVQPVARADWARIACNCPGLPATVVGATARYSASSGPPSSSRKATAAPCWACKRAAELQQKGLRAVPQPIMADQEDAGALPRRGQAGDGAGGGIEEGAAPMHVRLERGALRPLVPGVDADQRLALDRVAVGVADQVLQPRLIQAQA